MTHRGPFQPLLFCDSVRGCRTPARAASCHAPSRTPAQVSSVPRLLVDLHRVTNYTPSTKDTTKSSVHQRSAGCGEQDGFPRPALPTLSGTAPAAERSPAGPSRRAAAAMSPQYALETTLLQRWEPRGFSAGFRLRTPLGRPRFSHPASAPALPFCHVAEAATWDRQTQFQCRKY